jgi:hypothetical protein
MNLAAQFILIISLGMTNTSCSSKDEQEQEQEQEQIESYDPSAPAGSELLVNSKELLPEGTEYIDRNDFLQLVISFYGKYKALKKNEFETVEEFNLRNAKYQLEHEKIRRSRFEGKSYLLSIPRYITQETYDTETNIYTFGQYIDCYNVEDVDNNSFLSCQITTHERTIKIGPKEFYISTKYSIADTENSFLSQVVGKEKHTFRFGTLDLGMLRNPFARVRVTLEFAKRVQHDIEIMALMHIRDFKVMDITIEKDASGYSVVHLPVSVTKLFIRDKTTEQLYPLILEENILVFSQIE